MDMEGSSANQQLSSCYVKNVNSLNYSELLEWRKEREGERERGRREVRVV